MARRKRKIISPKKDKPGSSRSWHLSFTVALLVAMLILMHHSSENRYWHEYIDAGDRASKRGNYEWANKMYNQALQYAQNKGANDPLVAKTKVYLERLEKVKSHSGRR